MPQTSYIGRKGPTVRRVNTLTASSNIYTPDCASTDIAIINTPTAGFTVANPTSTPTDSQFLQLRIKSTTSYSIGWGANYLSSGLATLPTAGIANKTMIVLLQYDSTAAKWVCVTVDPTGY